MNGLANLGDLDFDEAATAYLAAMDDPRIMLETVLESFYHDPPLYYVILHGWQAGAGSSELALRILSVLFSTLSVAVVGAAIARVAGTRAAMVAAVVLAVAPVSVVFSRYARQYSLLLLCMALLVAAAAWGSQRSTSSRGSLANSVALAAYVGGIGNHFYALFGALATAPWLIPRRAVMAGLVAGSAAAGLWLLLSPRMREILATMHPRSLTAEEAWTALVRSLGALAGPAASASAYLVTAGALLAAAAVVFMRRRDLPSPVWQVVLSGWLVASLAIPLMSFLGAPLANRYLVVAAPFAAGMVGLAARFLPKMLVTSLVAAVLLGAGTVLRPSFDGFSWGDYGHAIERLRADFQPGDGVLLNGMAQGVLYSYYRDGLPEARIFPGPSLRDARAVTEAEATPVLAGLVAEHPRLWVVESATNFYDPAGIAEQWLAREAYPLPLVRFRDAVLRPYLTDGGGVGMTEQPQNALLLDVWLDGVAVESPPLRPGTQGRLRLTAHPEAAAGPRKVSLRLVAADGKGIWQVDRFFSGTDRLIARTVIEVPSDAFAGTYHLQAVVYETGPGGQITRTSEPLTIAALSITS